MKVDLPTLSYEPACFAGGTLLHTKNGLVPIEQIQVGDWVLSKHESGEGEREYKRVTKTFVHEDREVIMILCGGAGAGGLYCSYDLVVTAEHPFWVKREQKGPGSFSQFSSKGKNRAWPLLAPFSDRFRCDSPICGQLGIRHNTGKRGRPKGAADEKSSLPITGQQDFGF